MFSLIDNHHSFLRPSYTLTSALEAILDPLVSVLALYVITVLLGFTPGAHYVILGVLCFSLMFPGNAGFHESTRRVVRKVVTNWLLLVAILGGLWLRQWLHPFVSAFGDLDVDAAYPLSADWYALSCPSGAVARAVRGAPPAHGGGGRR